MNRKNTENSKADETVYDQEQTTEPALEPAVEPAAAASPAPAPAETDVLKDRLLRLQADFDNFRKRSVRERAEWQAFAGEQLIRELLPVVDHFELGLAMAEKQQTDPAVLNGLKIVYDQLLGILKKQGVTVLTAQPGSAFDPHLHEAISHLPSDEHPADVVIAETRRGYRLGDKLIRPLQVVVSSGAAAGPEGDEA